MWETSALQKFLTFFKFGYKILNHLQVDLFASSLS